MFKPIKSSISFPNLEEEILEFWKKNKVFEKSLEWRKGNEEYVFYDGPPFATGLPHYGHLLPGTMKDIIPRYQTMKGKLVNRRFGWDTHGLPVENEIEKKLDLKTKKDIENFGIKNFNKQCRSIVTRYVGEWEKTVERMGRWVNFKDAYITMDLNYMETIIWVFKELWKKDLIFEGHKILPYCPRCATPLSNFETNQGYKDVEDAAITVRFKLREGDNRYILAWTTTPWTLPSNMALAVGEDIDYVEVVDGDDHFIMAKARLSAYYKNEEDYKIEKEFKGKELVGLKYEPLLDYFADKEKEGAFKIISGAFVTTEDGAGIVHIAPGFGEDDAEVGRANGIPTVCPIDESGNFTDEIHDFEGLFVKDADKAIIKKLKEQGKLIKRDQYKHSYPHCWRCDSPLIYKAVSSWFVDVSKIKDKMLKANDGVNWVPDHLKKGRFGKWLEGARDWAISRNRFWGAPIPAWKSEKGETIVVGSVAELEELSGVKVDDLHKHVVDEITFKSPETGDEMRRVTEVLDCWFESGAMPYAQAHYPFENKEKFEASFPADFISESLDQTRGWFYTLIVLAAALFDKTAYKNVVVTGLVLAEDGKKMSKRLRNYPEVGEVFEAYGADALRIYLMDSALVKGEELKFSMDGIKDVIRSFHLPLWNSYSFFVTYANIDKWDPEKDMIALAEINNPLDRWMLSDLEKVIGEVNEQMGKYQLQKSIQPFLKLIDRLTNWYIRRSRRRFWKSEMDNEKRGAYTTLYSVLIRLSKVIAPFTPFIAEAIYSGLKKESDPISVHLNDYPEIDEKLRDSNLEKEMELAMRTVSMGRALRNQKKLKVRQPLAEINLVTINSEEKEILSRLDDIIKEELNVKRVVIKDNETDLVNYVAKPNFKVLGAKLGKDMKKAAGLIARVGGKEIEALIGGETLKLSDGDFSLAITAEDILIDRQEKPGLLVMNEQSLTVGLDTNLTEELIEEGMARDIVHHIQNMRKSAGFAVTDKIIVGYGGSDKIKGIVKNYSQWVKSEVLANSCVEIETGETIEFNGETCILSVKRDG